MKREESDLSYRGYMSILYKSMYFKNTRLRENLIKIASMCDETEITSFVNYIDDIGVLFGSMTPTVVELLNNCFN